MERRPPCFVVCRVAAGGSRYRCLRGRRLTAAFTSPRPGEPLWICNQQLLRALRECLHLLTVECLWIFKAAGWRAVLGCVGVCLSLQCALSLSKQSTFFFSFFSSWQQTKDFPSPYPQDVYPSVRPPPSLSASRGISRTAIHSGERLRLDGGGGEEQIWAACIRHPSACPRLCVFIDLEEKGDPAGIMETCIHAPSPWKMTGRAPRRRRSHRIGVSPGLFPCRRGPAPFQSHEFVRGD